jgi:hypothetical protein
MNSSCGSAVSAFIVDRFQPRLGKDATPRCFGGQASRTREESGDAWLTVKPGPLRRQVPTYCGTPCCEFYERKTYASVSEGSRS